MEKKKVLEIIIPHLHGFYEQMYYKKLEKSFTQDTIIGKFLDPLDLIHPVGDLEYIFKVEILGTLGKIDEEYFTKKFTIGELADIILQIGGKLKVDA